MQRQQRSTSLSSMPTTPTPSKDQVRFTLAVLPLMDPGKELRDAIELLSVAALTPASTT